MHSFTPRTCLWPLTGTLIATFALSIGLTFRSNHACYAGVCGEWLFPLQARLHVVVWYCWLALSVTVLGLRAFQPSIRTFLHRPFLRLKVPLLGKRIHVGGALVLLWIVALYGIVTGIWWQRLDSYFVDRGQAQGVLHGNHILAAIALTGHYGDITMGMALLPVSRHSALASFFKLSVSTTLTFHMLTAYTLFTLVMTHGILYVAWLSMQSTLSLDIVQPYPILEPTYLADEVYPGNTTSLGIWRASLIFTGLVATLILLVIVITALPKIRKQHFNFFYFTHLSSILCVIVVCLHASTMFYCTAPGLAMIVLDWFMRLYELRQGFDAQVAHLGKGWYMLSVDLPRQRLRGCACTSPLAHFYIRHSSSSLRELHPFTTTTHLASQQDSIPSTNETIPMQFLFRKARRLERPTRLDSVSTITEKTDGSRYPRSVWSRLLLCFSRENRSKPKMQWTESLANVADNETKVKNGNNKVRHVVSKEFDQEQDCNGSGIIHCNTKIRFEGPYFTPSTPQRYDTVICIVAGTGVSGALAIAAAFAAQQDDCNHATGCSCRTDRMRKEESAAPKGSNDVNLDTTTATTAVQPPPKSRNRWQTLSIWWSVRAEDYIELPFDSIRTRPGLEMDAYLTGPGRPRMDIGAKIQHLKATSIQHGSDGRIWAYISGPNGFITAAENVCKQEGVDYYGARWDI